ncbi:MAG TPA: hypothetical protein VGZ02_07905 [Candidatus Baltobacteraceae bacterium]|jgi:uncharacterized membrane protein YphA (DoxX/SURF4 family)|nr:hypothetical protein [Candidatus Baltobacteraceae bacterium]
MKAAFYARLLFGASAVLFGVVELRWHDSDMWQFLHPLGTLAATVAAWFLTIAVITGGIAVMFSRTTQFAWIALGGVFLIFSLVCVPDMIASPLNKDPYINFFEKFSIVCGALAGYSLSITLATRRVSLIRMSRILLGVCALSFAWAQVVYLQYTASLVPAWIPPNQMFWTIVTTIAFALAGIALLIDRQAALATNLMALMMALFGLLVWVPRIAGHPQVLSNWNEISMNYLMTAAAWVVGIALAFASAPSPERFSGTRLTRPVVR